MDRRLEMARRNRAILALVENDLGEIWGRDDSDAKEVVVAVDWSELFGLAARTAPPLSAVPVGYRQDTWTLHFAGLNYLFYQLPCKIVLLPPYTWEMRNYLYTMKKRAFSARFSYKSSNLSDRYAGLIDELKKLRDQDETFSTLLENKEYTTDLSREARDLLVTTFSEYLPEIYLALQENTVEFLDIINDLLLGSGKQPKRVLTLPEFDPDLKRITGAALDNWKYWNVFMENERPGQTAQNRIDAMALGYLEQLHQELFLRNQSLLFATRSPAMFQVMGYHPGTFPASGVRFLDHGFGTFSSARSWEYFAEIGYYRSGVVANPRYQIRKRKAKVDVLASSIAQGRVPDARRRSLLRRLVGVGLEWGTLRGAYDLEGLQTPPQWKRLSGSKEKLLVDLAAALLSKKKPQDLVEEKAAVAEEILERIEDILDSVPLTPTRRRTTFRAVLGKRSRSLITVETLPFFQIRSAVEGFLSEDETDTLERLFYLRDRNRMETISVANGLLLNASRRGPANDKEKHLWLFAVAFYFLDEYEETLSFFSIWRDLAEREVGDELRFVTMLLLADSMLIRSEYRGCLDTLERFTAEVCRNVSPEHLALWHIWRGKAVIRWIARFGEEQQDFPQDQDGFIAERVFAEYLSDAHALHEDKCLRDEEIKMLFWSVLLYGLARCLRLREGESGRVHDPEDRSLLFSMESALEEFSRRNASAEYYSSIAYFNWKFFLLSNDQDIIEKSLQYWNRAIELADERGLEEVHAIASDHLLAAKVSLERVSSGRSE